FRLQPGQTWHDGQPFTSEDFRFSWEVLIDDKVPAFTFREDANRIEDVEVIDEQTFRIILKESLPINKWLISYPVIPKHIFDHPEERRSDPTLQQSPYYTRYARQTVIGNGPYK